MSLQIEPLTAPIYVDEYGAARITGSRVLLDLVVYHHQQGEPPEEIARQFPTAPLANVYGAISYYLQHRDEVDEYIREGEEAAARLEAEARSRPEQQAFEARLERAMAERNAAAARG